MTVRPSGEGATADRNLDLRIENERLRAQIETMWEALQPFADIADVYTDEEDISRPVITIHLGSRRWRHVTVADIHRARDALDALAKTLAELEEARKEE
jgi:hypothetical protein